MEPRLRASAKQLETIIEFMERYGDLSICLDEPQARQRNDRLWQKLVGMLNSINGGNKKSPNNWMYVWIDWKEKTEQKYLSIRDQGNPGCSNSSTVNNQSLNELEQRVVQVLELNNNSDRPIIHPHNRTTEQIFTPMQLKSEPIESAANDTTLVDPQAVPNDNAAVILPTTNANANENPPAPSQEIITPELRQNNLSSNTSSPPPSPSPMTLSPLPRNIRSPRTARSQRNTRNTPNTPRRSVFRRQNLYDRTNEFVAIERDRLQLEFNRERHQYDRDMRRLRVKEARETRQHELEMERLRLEIKRVEATHVHNELIQKLCTIAESLVNTMQQDQPNQN